MTQDPDACHSRGWARPPRPAGEFATSTRERALRDAAADVCCWCGGRSLVNGEARREVVPGPPGSGNWVHPTTAGAAALCVASSVWNRIEYERTRAEELRAKIDNLVPRKRPK